MARKNKVQTAVEDFEAQFEDLVQEFLADVDLEKAEEYFSDSNLADAVEAVFIEQESDEDDEEDGETE